MNTQYGSRCDACGNPVSNRTKHKNFDRLYLTILEIGQSNVETGITYHELAEQLRKKGYDIHSGCTELAVKHWFYHAFFHKASNDCPINCLADLDTHLGCDFILKGETSLMLLEHQTMEKSTGQAKYAIRWAIFAVVVSLLTIGEVHDWVKGLFTKTDTSAKEEQIQAPTAKSSLPNRYDLKKLDTFLRDIPNRKANERASR